MNLRPSTRTLRQSALLLRCLATVAYNKNGLAMEGATMEKIISNPRADAVIVGSGLAGLTTALTVLDAGGRVVILEKEKSLGGNSMKASSGINICEENEADQASFRSDTLNSAGMAKNEQLVEQLVQHSHEAIYGWLQSRLSVDISKVSQLGGHSMPRTYRPAGKLPIGAEIMLKLQKAIREHEDRGNATILPLAVAKELVKDTDGQVTGVKFETTKGESKATMEVQGSNVVLATGGYASDRSSHSWLARYRPELLQLGATAGGFSTGDGLNMATQAGAGLVGMEHVQVHPTGFIDPQDPENPNKILAAEVLRGVGGILLNAEGQRFCNEVGRRDYVTDRILSLHPSYAETKSWRADYRVPQVYLLLSGEGASNMATHMGFYAGKGYLKKVTGVQQAASFMGISKETLKGTLQEYAKDAAAGNDQFGKSWFTGVPDAESVDDTDVLYVGRVTPVLHYCMGGVQINPDGQVLSEDGGTIANLYAAGEVSGGVHGENRLGGNSLCECVVFGRIIGQAITRSCGQE
eukprot:Nitzschia sp. Nitz4//scaffold484_size5321//2933//4569//NITZ4_009228-RA/size5321-processed-gene-0.3-mRNA-1//1//CDS//3329552886//1578//frame0